MFRSFTLGLLALSITSAVVAAEAPKKLSVLFLGDRGHHRPSARAKELLPALAKRGVTVTYTDDMAQLNPETLAKYDALMIYANITKISERQEKALMDFVAGGKGLVPLHCASYCFLNSPKYIALVGGQFRRHGGGVFRTKVVKPEHPIMQGIPEFETWDETYVHHKHNEKDRVVLQVRDQEPWTWVRTHGKGRVFYTAYGHDKRTWTQPAFHVLVERGIRWAAGSDNVVPHSVKGLTAEDKPPKMTPKRKDVKPFEYVEANIPFYNPRRGGRKNWGKMQKPLSPAESAKHMVTPVGFEARLFAADPDFVNAICMTWDDRGRLWIAETIDYPNEMQKPGAGRDRIKILEDTDGDGRADKVTVFADKLSIPTSMVFGGGGLIVQQAPHTLLLRDTNGDDKADERKILFSGWGTRDTHAGPSNLAYGLDNWIWGMVGYSGFRGTVGGERIGFSMGFYRFKPDGSKLEFIRSTNNNTWGIGFSEEGIVFGSTANNNPSVYMPIANRYYEQVRGWSAARLGGIANTSRFLPITDKVRQVDAHGRYTAGAGHALYTARTYPKRYWNRTSFVAGPTGHLAGVFELIPKGSDFTSRNEWNLLASDDEWSAPITAEVGPDGHVWVSDWYNYIVQHNPTPRGFRNGRGNAYMIPLRDKKHGRIYRVVYKDAKKQKPMRLDKATPEQLVAALSHDNLLWRRHAQRRLVERGKADVAAALVKLIQDKKVDDIGLNVGAIHALWTLHGLGQLDGSNTAASAAVIGALKHPSAGVRRNAVAVAQRSSSTAAEMLSAGLLSDTDAQVRLAALLALSEMPADDAAGRAIVKVLVDPKNASDRWITEAATSAAATHGAALLGSLAGVKPSGSALVNATRIVAEHYARGDDHKTAATVFAGLGTADPQLAAAAVAGLVKGWPKGRALPQSEPLNSALFALYSQVPTNNRLSVVTLAERLGAGDRFRKVSAELVKKLIAQLNDPKQSDAVRVAGARQLLATTSDAKVSIKLLDAITPQASPDLANGLLEALGTSQAVEVGAGIVARYNTLTPVTRRTAIAVLLRRPDWTASLLAAMEKSKLSIDELALDQQQLLTAHANKSISGRAKKLLAASGGLVSPDRQKVFEQLLPLTKKTGDPKLGKVVFKNQCAKCHTHTGEGAKIGPDLTGMAVHPKAELLKHIIDPNASVEGNYRQYSIVTADGLTVTGMLLSETRTSVEVLDSQAKKHVILREDIEQVVASKKSVMPEGFEKQPAADVVNLLEFLTQRGKYLPLSLAKVATSISTRGMFFKQASRHERLVFPDWKPKMFGSVPFHLVDPQGDQVKNVVLLHGPNGFQPPKMPKSVSLPCNASAKAIHMLSGVGGWSYPAIGGKSVSMIVRLHYADGKTEDHPLLNGVHFADYIRRIDVPGSKFAFALRGQQIRYLAVHPKRTEKIKTIELVKGTDASSPIVMAVTIE